MPNGGKASVHGATLIASAAAAAVVALGDSESCVDGSSRPTDPRRDFKSWPWDSNEPTGSASMCKSVLSLRQMATSYPPRSRPARESASNRWSRWCTSADHRAASAEIHVPWAPTSTITSCMLFGAQFCRSCHATATAYPNGLPPCRTEDESTAIGSITIAQSPVPRPLSDETLMGEHSAAEAVAGASGGRGPAAKSAHSCRGTFATRACFKPIAPCPCLNSAKAGRRSEAVSISKICATPPPIPSHVHIIDQYPSSMSMLSTIYRTGLNKT